MWSTLVMLLGSCLFFSSSDSDLMSSFLAATCSAGSWNRAPPSASSSTVTTWWWFCWTATDNAVKPPYKRHICQFKIDTFVNKQTYCKAVASEATTVQIIENTVKPSYLFREINLKACALIILIQIIRPRRRRRWCLIRWFDWPHSSKLHDPSSTVVSLLLTDWSILWRRRFMPFVVYLFLGSLQPFPWWYISPSCQLPFTGWAVAQTCCISQWPKYRKRGIFDHPWEQNPWTDRHETWSE